MMTAVKIVRETLSHNVFIYNHSTMISNYSRAVCTLMSTMRGMAFSRYQRGEALMQGDDALREASCPRLPLLWQQLLQREH